MSVLRKVFLLLALASVLITGPAVSAESYFALVGWRGEFTRIDAATYDVVEMGDVLPHELQAITLTPEGTLLAGPGAAGELFTVDPETGAAELVLSVDSDIRAMAFSPLGDLYVTARDDPIAPTQLRILNLGDGSFIEIGPIGGVGVQPQGLAFSPEGVLYAVRPFEENYDIFTIDPVNAEIQLLGRHEGDLHQGLAFTPDGSLYAVGPSVFGQLDPVTGAVIGDTIALAGDFRSIAYVPEPATLLLLSTCAMAFGLRRGLRSRRRA